MDRPSATVRSINGQLVLDDPDALAMIRAVNKHNCAITLEINKDRVIHFKQRMKDRGLGAADVVIVLLNVDDPNGGPLAEVLMPGHDWQSIRDRGEVPFARGLVSRDSIQGGIDALDSEAGNKLRETKGIAVIVLDHGVAEIFEA